MCDFSGIQVGTYNLRFDPQKCIDPDSVHTDGNDYIIWSGLRRYYYA